MVGYRDVMSVQPTRAFPARLRATSYSTISAIELGTLVVCVGLAIAGVAR